MRICSAQSRRDQHVLRRSVGIAGSRRVRSALGLARVPRSDLDGLIDRLFDSCSSDNQRVSSIASSLSLRLTNDGMHSSR